MHEIHEERERRDQAHLPSAGGLDQDENEKGKRILERRRVLGRKRREREIDIFEVVQNQVGPQKYLLGPKTLGTNVLEL